MARTAEATPRSCFTSSLKSPAFSLSILVFLAVLACAAAAQAAPLSPGDPYYPGNQNNAQGYYATLLGLQTAWGISTGSTNVTVAIVDTGVNVGTPDLAGRILPAQAAPGLTVLDGVDLSHGTQMASVVAMGVNNGVGGAGIGNFSILPITVTDGGGQFTSDDVGNGIIMAANSGARVINVSLGPFLNYGVVDAAAAYARSKGALVIVAAGNNNAEVDFSAYPNLIFVSGTDKNNARWVNSLTVGSTYGPGIGLSAPAQSILFADPNFDEAGYGLGTGTSYSAALVSGAAALAWSIDPNLTPDQVQALLYSTATDLGPAGWDETYGWGLLNVGGVAEGAYEALPEPATLALLMLGGVAAVALRRKRR